MVHTSITICLFAFHWKYKKKPIRLWQNSSISSFINVSQQGSLIKCLYKVPFLSQTIQTQEEKMNCLLKRIKESLPDVYRKAKFNLADLLAVLQGVAGFFSGALGKDPFSSIDSAIGVGSSLLGKQCLPTLESSLDSIKKWLTFGKEYTPLVDSSELDFDKLDVASVPEIMQVRETGVEWVDGRRVESFSMFVKIVDSKPYKKCTDII